ncbi:membrane integral protein [Tubulinosema ratisbonensis]|uniref:Membrane integral protein n=1 Tax=Tubulinosema ratisbonensis TaxID=291195 RepID=A0A437AKR8_9MICR|nr:membrane integral protein [Tubulinosema ratisbonensis]
MFFLFLIKVFSYTLNLTDEEINLELQGLENTIYTGSFELKSPGDVKISIIGKKTKNVFFSTKMTEPIKEHFTFNLSEADSLILTMISKGESEIRYLCDTQFDTFNKGVASQVAVKPAISTLIMFEETLSKVAKQTYEAANNIRKLREGYKNMFNFVFVLSLLMTVLYLLLNYVQYLQVRKFFKQKKLI